MMKSVAICTLPLACYLLVVCLFPHMMYVSMWLVHALHFRWPVAGLLAASVAYLHPYMRVGKLLLICSNYYAKV
jgi:hypothetical protein